MCFVQVARGGRVGRTSFRAFKTEVAEHITEITSFFFLFPRRFACILSLQYSYRDN